MKQTIRTASQLKEQPQTAPPSDTFDSLYQRYVEKVFQKCLGMTKDTNTAQDYTQDIFIKVFEHFDSFQHRSSFATWLYSISHNHCLDQIRLGKRLTTAPLTHEVASDVADQTDSVEVRLQMLDNLLQRLPAQEVAFLRLKLEEGLSIKEIAARYQLKESTVKMRLKRTRDKLQALYAEQLRTGR
ncbi:sigma-70 family RNA polymerase sigma factor [Spirosoma sp. HMF4905]|uniref:Sigma-70 family RNA polymerase sigma factor n=1 Tax=Spirosoma arboris TaxID=2682092 RepID=A0A7K1SPG9_9BACT|nr:RNA polymerase sigma factor [Spirosoma arboris]MVM35620.1 sigma-70 family RNA polymerase sigma factor [Spirosoma arboris]